MAQYCDKEGCDSAAVATIPLPEKGDQVGELAVKRVCLRHYESAVSSGFFVIHDDEKESAAATRCDQMAMAKHLRLTGQKYPRTDECGRWRLEYEHLQEVV